LFCPRCARVFGDADKICAFDGAELTATFEGFIQHKATRLSGAILADRYKLHGALDRGATARIFLAEDLVQHRPVVVKMMDAPHWHDERKRERFLREAEAAKIVDHPNVADTYFIGQRADGTPFYVMEFLFGESLGARLRREERLDGATVLRIAEHVALGLDAAHLANVFHRDVKPDNVFLVGEPGAHHSVKILDFGYAKAGDTSITGGGMVIGTVEYMAPEQCLCDPVDARTDVFGLGAVMYRALTGSLLVESDEAMGVRLAKQVLAVPAWPRDLDEGIDPSVEAIVMRAVRKDPALRYQSMSSLLRDLRAALAGEAIPRVDRSIADAYPAETPLAREVAAAFAKSLSESGDRESLPPWLRPSSE
jgi:serine/threonine-protein kinase